MVYSYYIILTQNYQCKIKGKHGNMAIPWKNGLLVYKSFKDQKEKVILYIVFITDRSDDPAEEVEQLSLSGIFLKK